MPVQSGVELACRLAVASTGRMTTIFESRRIVDVVAERDYNNSGMHPENSVVPVESVLLMDLV